MFQVLRLRDIGPATRYTLGHNIASMFKILLFSKTNTALNTEVPLIDLLHIYLIEVFFCLSNDLTLMQKLIPQINFLLYCRESPEE